MVFAGVFRAGLSVVCVGAVALASRGASAETIRMIVDHRAPISNSEGVGYEEIRGRLVGEVDPKAASNAIIQDIAAAPRNARGKVEYVSTFTIWKPVDAAGDSGVLIAAVPNRGGRGVVSWGDRDTIDPIYFKRGYSVLWVGWQGDLSLHPTREASVAGSKIEAASVPRARRADGEPIIGRYLVRVPTVGGAGPRGATMKLDQGSAGPLSYMPATFDTAHATLTGGPAEDNQGRTTGSRYTIPSSHWMWWDCIADAPPRTTTAADALCVRLRTGSFNPDQTYLLVFDVKDPLVLGLGMAAIRDGVSFFRYAARDAAGVANPLKGRVRYTIGQGVSQVGNLVKTMIALGFNADERGRRVWDGAQVHIAGRRAPINYRFATPGSSASLFMPGSEGILWWGRAAGGMRDGRPRSLLDRCSATRTCPKIFETFGGAELWNQRMTPGLVGFDRAHDIALPPNVRRYFFPGTQHGGGAGGFALTSPQSECRLPLNQNPQTDQMRALTLALVDWVASGKAPPASAYPTLAQGTLVRDTQGSYRFPSLPGAGKPFGLANPLLRYDYGKQFDYVDMSGIITNQPPAIDAIVPALVAQVDSDGNETSGVPSVQLMAPLGTYLSWNVFRAGPYAGRICSFNGSFLPFPKTAADREAAGDPRASIEERYGSRAGYVTAVTNAVTRSEKGGFLLPEDGQRLIAEARAATENGDLRFLKP